MPAPASARIALSWSRNEYAFSPGLNDAPSVRGIAVSACDGVDRRQRCERGEAEKMAVVEWGVHPGRDVVWSNREIIAIYNAAGNPRP